MYIISICCMIYSLHQNPHIQPQWFKPLLYMIDTKLQVKQAKVRNNKYCTTPHIKTCTSYLNIHFYKLLNRWSPPDWSAWLLGYTYHGPINLGSMHILMNVIYTYISCFSFIFISQSGGVPTKASINFSTVINPNTVPFTTNRFTQVTMTCF